MWILLLFSLSFSAVTERWVFVGDSLTEGYGISKDNAFPALLEKKLNAYLKETKQDRQIKVINAGVSGSTSSSGLSRLKWHLKEPAAVVVIALGANDGLRGQSVDNLIKSLNEMAVFAKAQKAKVVIAGMKLPQNYGADYIKRFEASYVNVSKKQQVALIPFLLDGVATNKSLNLSDGIHPNEKGHQILADKLFPFFKGLL